MERAETLVSECPYDNRIRSTLRLQKQKKELAEYDLIIQTTSIGMSPNVDETPLECDQL